MPLALPRRDIMIEVNNLNFNYPTKRVLFDINLKIGAGLITALVGPNGAGKTTLINCLVGLHAPAAGRVMFEDIDVAGSPREAHRRMGYLPDFYGLYDELTVRQCLVHGAEMHGITRAEAKRLAEFSAARLNVADRLDDKVSSLSRGLTQRAAIARSIIHDPAFLVLDEPAAGLDPDARAQLSALFRQLRDDGMTLLVSSHILAELEDYCTDMIIIRDGRVVHQGIDAAAADAEMPRRMSIELAEPHGKFAEILASSDGIAELRVDGTRAQFHLAGGNAHQFGLLKTLMAAGLPIIRYADEQERLQDTYHRTVAGNNGAGKAGNDGDEGA